VITTICRGRVEAVRLHCGALAVEESNALDTVSNTLSFDPETVRRAFRDEHWHNGRSVISA
jgi:hypothetical protein